MKNEITTGLLLKTMVTYDENSIELKKQKLQFPLQLFPFGWRGFIGSQSLEFELNEDIIYYENKNSIFQRPTLYLSRESRYDSLPTSEEQLKTDDEDDFTYQYLPSKEEVTEFDEDLYESTDTMQIRFNRKQLDEILSCVKKSKANQAITHRVGSIFSLKKECLAYTERWAFHVKSKLFKESEIDSTPIRHMAFFVKSKDGLLGKQSLYCGYHKQIFIKKIGIHTLSTFNEFCIKYAPRLSEKGDTYKSSLLSNPFSIANWFRRDTLCLTPNAVIFTRKSFKHDEMAYVPYKKINMFLSSPGLLTQYIEIYGEQNIIPRFKFSRNDVSKIRSVIEANGIKPKTGETFYSARIFPKNWFGRAPRIVCIDDQVVYYPKRIAKELGTNDKGVVVRASSLKINEIYEVSWNKKFLRLFGDILVQGEPYIIREDQKDTNKEGNTVRMIIPSLFFCKKGKMKSYFDKYHIKMERNYERLALKENGEQ